MNNSATSSLETGPKWSPLVELIAAGSTSAVEELYKTLTPIKLYFTRHIGSERAQDAYHDVFIELVNAVVRGTLRNSECLAGYAWTIAYRKIVPYIDSAVKQRIMPCVDEVAVRDLTLNPEQEAIRAQEREVALRVLKGMPARDREVLVRFYVEEQTAHEIEAAMDLTGTQFRLIKSRAKKRFAELLHNRIDRKLVMSEHVTNNRQYDPVSRL